MLIQQLFIIANVIFIINGASIVKDEIVNLKEMDKKDSVEPIMKNQTKIEEQTVVDSKVTLILTGPVDYETTTVEANKDSTLKTEITEEKIEISEEITTIPDIKEKVTSTPEVQNNVAPSQSEQPPSVPPLTPITAIQSIAATITNALATKTPPENIETTTNPSYLQSAIVNLQNSFIANVNRLNSTLFGLINGANEATTVSQENTNINYLTNSLAAIQQNFQNSISQLNQSFYNFINRPAEKPTTTHTVSVSVSATKLEDVNNDILKFKKEFEDGLKYATELTTSKSDSLKATDEGSNAVGGLNEGTTLKPTQVNIFQQFIENWQSSLASSFQNLNATIQNIINPQQGTDDTENTSTHRPGFIQNIQQSLQNFGQSIQTFVSGGQPGTNDQTDGNRPTNFIQQGLETINQNIHNILNRPQVTQNVQTIKPNTPEPERETEASVTATETSVESETADSRPIENTHPGGEIQTGPIRRVLAKNPVVQGVVGVAQKFRDSLKPADQPRKGGYHESGDHNINSVVGQVIKPQLKH